MADKNARKKTVIDGLLEECERMESEGVEVSPTALKNAAAGHSWRDVMAAIAKRNEQFELPDGAPVLPDLLRNRVSSLIDCSWAELCRQLARYEAKVRQQCEDQLKDMRMAFKAVVSENDKLGSELENKSLEAGNFARQANENALKAVELQKRLHDLEVGYVSIDSERKVLAAQNRELHERLLAMAETGSAAAPGVKIGVKNPNFAVFLHP